MTKPLCIDLFCGLGGWAEGFIAEGYRVVGFDVDPRFAGPYRAAGGEFVLQDVRTLDGWQFRGATCIVASPPCNEFSRLNFLRPSHPPPNTGLVEAVWRIRAESGVPTVLENVEGARRYIGPAVAHRGSWYLWGDVPLLFDGHLPPKVGTGPWRGRRTLSKSGWSDRDRGTLGAARRARIPPPIARAVARGFL